jgi:hypothetical protein
MRRQAVLHGTFEGREIVYILLVTRTFLALEIVLHDLTNRVCRGELWDAIGLPPVHVLRIGHRLSLSLAERRPVCTRTDGSGAGAAMAPEGEDHVTAQARLGCKRNVRHTLVHTWSPTRSAPLRLSPPVLVRG